MDDNTGFEMQMHLKPQVCSFFIFHIPTNHDYLHADVYNNNDGMMCWHASRYQMVEKKLIFPNDGIKESNNSLYHCLARGMF